MNPRPIPLATAAAAALSAIVTLGAVPSAAAGPMPAIGASAGQTVLRSTSAGPATVTAGTNATAPVKPRVTTFAIPEVAAAKASPASPSSPASPAAPGSPAAQGRRIVAQSEHTGVSFDVAGVTFTGHAPADLAVQVRTRHQARWTGWMDVKVDLEDGPDAGSAEGRRARPGTEAVAAVGADGIQVRVLTSGAAPKDLQLAVVDGGSSPADAAVDPAGSVAGPAAAPAVAGARSSVATDSAATLTAATTASAVASAPAVARPAIVTRAQWGADERLMPCQPDQLAGFKAAVVHHTVDANSYTSTQAPALMRAIFAFHTQSRGWCDIGYNFLVDRYGRIYEGRKGSLTGFTQGAQSGGFNQETFGVSVIGDFTSIPFPAAVQSSVAKVIAWEADRTPFDPSSSVTLLSAGSTRYSPGVRVTKPRVMGHRDLSLTSCPGDSAYPQVAGIRSSAASQWRAGQYAGRAGRYTPVAARRFIDTRSGLGAPRALLVPGASITVRPPGLPADVTAVTLNVTTTAATRSTSVSVFPAGQVPRSSSVLNTGPGRTSAAAVTVGVGPGGAVTLRNTSGGLHVIADLAGYYSTGSSSGLVGSFHRVLDTRSGLGAPARRVDPSRPLTIALPGLPAGTRAVNLNLTATRAQGAGHLTAYAGGASRPSTSNVNFVAGQTVANLATVPVGSGGTVTIHATAPTDVVADVAGAFVAGSGSRFTPVSPRRVLDTRYGWAAPYQPLVGGRSLAVPIAGVPSSASGVAMTLSATSATRPTALTVYATGSAQPNTSNVNVTPGQAISGSVVSGIRSSSASVSSTSGTVAVIADLMGYYGS